MKMKVKLKRYSEVPNLFNLFYFFMKIYVYGLKQANTFIYSKVHAFNIMVQKLDVEL